MIATASGAGAAVGRPVASAVAAGAWTVVSAPARASLAGRVSLAVLGDSDSHAFHDRVAQGYGSEAARGGPWQASTWQWTEILARLRGDRIDQGVFDTVGRRGALAWLMRRTGLGPVRQHKQDFRFNLAYNGAVCADLNRPDAGQAPVLAGLMDQEPARWRADSALLVRIGINDLGRVAQLDRFARDGLDPAVSRRVATCLDEVGKAVATIRRRHPQVALILVGVLDNVDWPRLHGRWQDPLLLGRIRSVLDAYDDGLKALAAASGRAAFIDDRAAFRQWFGGRDARGMPAYRELRFGPAGEPGAGQLVLADGDSPDHAVLADGHAGTVWNGLFANAVITTLNRLGLPGAGPPIAPLDIDALRALADPERRSRLHGAPALGGR